MFTSVVPVSLESVCDQQKWKSPLFFNKKQQEDLGRTNLEHSVLWPLYNLHICVTSLFVNNIDGGS